MFDAGTTPYGQWPKLSANHSHVCSPAVRDLNHENAKLRASIDKKDESFDRLVMKEEMGILSVNAQANLHTLRQDKEDEKARLQINLNIQQNKEEEFGQGKIASGYRTANGHALDWAIGEPLSERTGANNVRPRAIRY